MRNRLDGYVKKELRKSRKYQFCFVFFFFFTISKHTWKILLSKLLQFQTGLDLWKDLGIKLKGCIIFEYQLLALSLYSLTVHK